MIFYNFYAHLDAFTIFRAIFYCFFSYCLLKRMLQSGLHQQCLLAHFAMFHHFFNCLFSFRWLLLKIIFTAHDVILQSELELWRKARTASVCAQGQGRGSEPAAAHTSQAASVDRWAFWSSLRFQKSLPSTPINISFQSICHFDQFILGLNIFFLLNHPVPWDHPSWTKLVSPLRVTGSLTPGQGLAQRGEASVGETRGSGPGLV